MLYLAAICVTSLTIPQKFRGVEFLAPLVKDMIQTDPSKRPTIQEVVRRFEELLKGLDSKTLRLRLIAFEEDAALTLFRNIRHPFRTLRYVLLRKSAIPVPP